MNYVVYKRYHNKTQNKRAITLTIFPPVTFLCELQWLGSFAPLEAEIELDNAAQTSRRLQPKQFILLFIAFFILVKI